MGFLHGTLTALVIVNLCGLSQQQDQQNYFYTQNQGRFAPPYQNPRNNAYFGQAQPRNPQPGSFQEQTLYVGAPGAPAGGAQAAGQLPDSSTSAYFPFPPFTFSLQLQTTRHPELFEISPRPFAGQPLRNNAFQFQRIPPTGVPLPPQPLPDFPPRNLPPHQAADLFLNQIGLERGQQHRQDQPATREKNPGRNAGAFKASAADDYLTSHEETFRSRNRHRTTEAPEVKNVRAKPTKGVSPDAIELRKTPPVQKIQQLLRSRPVPYDQPEATPFPKNPEPPKINISHNGSTKQSNELPTLEDNYPDYYYDTADENLMARVKNPEEKKRVATKEESSSQEQINPNVYVPNMVNLDDTSKHIRDNKATLEEKLPEPTEAPKAEVITAKEEVPEDHTVILTSNFYLPENQNEETPEDKLTPVESDDEEYEYEDYADEDENIPQITTASPTFETPTDKSTTQALETETPNIASPMSSENISTTTESWVVIASVQTSRSVSGARFLPFPQVEQEEKKQSLSDLEKDGKASEEEESKDDDLLERNIANSTPEQEEFTTLPNEEEIKTDSTPEATSHSAPASGAPQSTESIIDKLDRVQSELSSGVLSGKFPILNETLEDVTTKSTPVVVVKKFSPRTTAAPTSTTTTTTKKPEIKKLVFETLPMDDLAALLPPGYKSRVGYKNKKIPTTSTTTTTAAPEVKSNSSALANLMSSIFVKDLSVLGLLPKNYTTEAPVKSSADDILQKAQKVDISAFLPSGYVASPTTPKAVPKKPLTVTVEDDISKFLPAGYRLPKTTKMPPTTSTAAPAIPIVDDISKFLPPGFKLNDSVIPKAEKVDISKFLPANYTEKPQEIQKVVSSTPATTTTASAKVVFPSRPGFLAKKPGQRPTTPKSTESGGPPSPDIVIRHGPPTRATTEFTGWPTPSTTPLSIEKILERQRTSTVDPPDFFSASTTARTTTTTTTRTTTQRPTEPGICQADCDLAATIKIIGGVMWKPELLDHNTDEWKSLAREMETQLNSVYGKHPMLSKWFRKVRIDSFSKGSVLVDYFVELANMPERLNTLELKKLFHSALTTVTTEPPEYTTEFEDDPTTDLDDDFGPVVRERVIEPKAAKETLQLGHFIIDPISTDFIVIHKQIAPTVEFAEENQLLPQWAIAVIVIGVGSLLFVIIFGVTVLLNRKNKAKKKAPAPLTTDMLNELNKNHMGGVENYGHEEFYNVEDAWDDEADARHHEGGKSKRYGHPMASAQSNIYDSWRSQRHPGYYYDSHHYPQKVGPYPADAFMDYHAPTQANSMPMYTYNPRRYRDYDEDF
ncbi:mucin-2 [Phlebotomus argentipes]|uniref:mucin-2 n=1 Tax=Phlebotomus argentipes TaxID=94469 RepID=UPI002892CE88|nr:mucin-2 [Phlebotomus argentipes]